MLAKLDKGTVIFDLPFHLNHMAKDCGARFHPSTKTWRVKLTKPVASAICRTFKQNEIDPGIIDAAQTTAEIPPLDIDPQSVVKTKLVPRQVAGVQKAWPLPAFALFWSMGAGKTLASICLINLRRQMGLIDRALVIAPNAILNVWKNQYAEHSAIPTNVQVFEAGDKIGNPDVLVVSVEGMSQGKLPGLVMGFVKAGRCMVIVDESSRIKNHDTVRTKEVIDIGQECAFRMILTGTAITKGIENLYSQMYFLDPSIIGQLSYYSFRNKYCVMGGFEQRKIIGYKHVDELMALIRPHSDYIAKSDIEGLPPYSFEIRNVTPSPDQIRMCKELKRDLVTQYGEQKLEAQNTLEVMLRLQQMSGGFLPDAVPIGTRNPKIDAMMDVLEEFDGKAIIWARFLPEIEAIQAAINERWPDSCIKLVGGATAAEKQAIEDAIQTDPDTRFLVTNQQTGGYGFTFTATTLSIYFSMTFAYEDYAQSLDRNHRMGQKEAVKYVFLVSGLKVDKVLMESTEQKKSLADFVGNRMRLTDMF